MNAIKFGKRLAEEGVEPYATLYATIEEAAIVVRDNHGRGGAHEAVADAATARGTAALLEVEAEVRRGLERLHEAIYGSSC